LKEAVPGIARVACPYRRPCLRESDTVRVLSLEVQDLDVLALQDLAMDKPEDFEHEVIK